MSGPNAQIAMMRARVQSRDTLVATAAGPDLQRGSRSGSTPGPVRPRTPEVCPGTCPGAASCDSRARMLAKRAAFLAITPQTPAPRAPSRHVAIGLGAAPGAPEPSTEQTVHRERRLPPECLDF